MYLVMVVLTTLPIVNSALSVVEPHEKPDLVQLAENIAKDYYVNDSKGLVLIAERGFLQEFYISNVATFRATFQNFCDDPEFLDIMVQIVEEMCFTFIVQIHEPYCFFKAWFNAQWLTILRPHLRVLFLPVYPENVSISHAVFSLKETEHSSAILAIDVNNDTEWPFSIYTSNFYERFEEPGRNPKMFLDKWNRANGYKNNTNLMPDFLENLRNKTLKLMTFDYDPYTHVNPLDGTEIKLLQEFCRKHNCSLEVVDDGHYWGDVFDNGTSDGMAGMVYDGRADFGAAAVYLWIEFFNFVDFSTSYLYSASTLLVPKPHLEGPWKTPFMPFDAITWASYILSVVMAAVFMYIITALTIKYTRFAEEVKKRQMFVDKLDSVFRALGLAVLQQPTTKLVPHTPIRHLFTSFEFLFLITSSIYAAELASYLTVPRYTKPIDTLIEFAESGMIWVGEHQSWTFSLRGMTDPEIITIVENYQVYSHEILNEIAPTGEYALIVERLPGGHYTEQEHVTDRVIAQSHMMAENLFGSPPVIALRKGSPYRKCLNRIVSNVLRGGLYLYWEGEMARKYLSSRKQLALKDADHPHYRDDPKRLAISHIQGGLYLYAVGIIISSLVFIAELMVNRMNKL